MKGDVGMSRHEKEGEQEDACINPSLHLYIFMCYAASYAVIIELQVPVCLVLVCYREHWKHDFCKRPENPSF